MKLTQHIAVIMALAIAVTSQVYPARAQSSMTQAEGDRARELLVQGTEAIDAGDYEQARALLRNAFELMQSYDIAAALGQAELKLGEYPEAATHLAFALRQYPPSHSRGLKQIIAEGFAKARQQVALLRLSVTPPDAEVSINGISVGAASALPPDIFVAPGTQEISAVTRHSRALQTVVAAAGGEHAVTLTVDNRLDPAAAAGAIVGTPDPHTTPGIRDQTSSPAERPNESGRSWAPIIAGGAITALAAGAGIYFSIAASNDRDEMRELKRENGKSGCAGELGRTAACEEQAEAVRDADRNANLAVFSYSLAGAALVATAGYWLWMRSDRNAAAIDATTPRVQAAIASDRAVFTLAGSF